MAHRSLIFALLAVCLFYVIQASPMPRDGEQTQSEADTLAAVQAALTKSFEAAREGFNAVINDPNLKQFGESISRTAQEAAHAVQVAASNVAKQIAPKTE